MTTEDIRKWYDFEAETYYQRRFTSKVGGYMDLVVKKKLLRYLQPWEILELGVGTGRHAIYLSKKGFNVVGIDLSQGMLEECRRKAHKNDVLMELYQMDAHNLQFSNAKFDSVYCDRAFKFFNQPEKVLKEVHRVLKPGGRLVLVLVSIETAESRNRRQNRILIRIRNKLHQPSGEKAFWRESGSGLKATAYSKTKLTAMLRGTHFKVLAIENLYNFPRRLIRLSPIKLLDVLLAFDEYCGLAPYGNKQVVVAEKE